MKVPEWLKESTKEFLRVVLLAVLPVAIMGIENGTTDWKLISTVAMVAGLRWIDSALHEWGKENDNDRAVKGLTQF
jgi:hypothetical protein